MESQGKVVVKDVNGKDVTVRALTMDDIDVISEIVETFFSEYQNVEEAKVSLAINGGVKAANVALRDCCTPSIKELGTITIGDMIRLVNAWMEANKWEELVPVFTQVLRRIMNVAGQK